MQRDVLREVQTWNHGSRDLPTEFIVGGANKQKSSMPFTTRVWHMASSLVLRPLQLL